MRPSGHGLSSAASSTWRAITNPQKARLSKSPELVFLRGYRDAITHFNMLDRNLAYCLRWASIYDGREVDLMSVLSCSFDKKLKKIVRLIESRDRQAEYGDFLVLAEQCRTLRNKLVHGDWKFVPHLPKPIRFHVPAPFEEEGYMTEREFSALVSP